MRNGATITTTVLFWKLSADAPLMNISNLERFPFVKDFNNGHVSKELIQTAEEGLPLQDPAKIYQQVSKKWLPMSTKIP